MKEGDKRRWERTKEKKKGEVRTKGGREGGGGDERREGRREGTGDEGMDGLEERGRNEGAGTQGTRGEKNGKLTDLTGKKIGRRELTFLLSY